MFQIWAACVYVLNSQKSWVVNWVVLFLYNLVCIQLTVFFWFIRAFCCLRASGISLKTQELYVIVFLTRYLDIFTRFVSPYNTIMKLVFIGTSIGIVWYMKYHKVVKQTYNKNEDTFRHYILVLPCFVLALLFHRDFSVMEVNCSTISYFIWSKFPHCFFWLCWMSQTIT